MARSEKQLKNITELHLPLPGWCCRSLAKLCLTLCDPVDCSTPGFSVLHYLLAFAQTYIHWINDAIQPSHPLLSPFSSCPQSFPASGSFPMSQLFPLGGQSIGASASASVLLMNIQGWFPLGVTVLISWCPGNPQESSPAPQLECISSLALSLLYGLTSVHDYWKTVAWTM